MGISICMHGSTGYLLISYWTAGAIVGDYYFVHRVGHGFIVAAFFIALAPGQTIAALL